MQKPIFRVFVKYNIRNKGKVTRGKNGMLDTFALTDSIKSIEKDEEIHVALADFGMSKSKAMNQSTAKTLNITGTIITVL